MTIAYAFQVCVQLFFPPFCITDKSLLANFWASCCCCRLSFAHLLFHGLQMFHFFPLFLLTHFRTTTSAIPTLKSGLHHASGFGKYIVSKIFNPESAYYYYLSGYWFCHFNLYCQTAVLWCNFMKCSWAYQFFFMMEI